LIEDVRRHPFTGPGKPEDLKGWWSRRITGAHRLVYRASGQAEDQRLEIVACRYHCGGGGALDTILTRH
jgi:toxin YoeB